MIELIEDLCTEMNKYQLTSPDNSSVKDGSNDSNDETQRWILSSETLVDTNADDRDDGSTEESLKHVLKEQRRILRISCSDIIGSWEDDIAEAITSGKADPENIRDVLCVSFGKYCPTTSSQAAAESHRPADEL